MRDFANLNVYSAIFGVLKINYSQDSLTDLDEKYTKNVVPRKNVPF